MDATTANAVFEAAAKATRWESLTFGRRTEITLDGYEYMVELPVLGPNPSRAEINFVSSWGNTEYVSVTATWRQTMRIVEVAMSATRIR